MIRLAILLLISFPGNALLVEAQHQDINKSLETVIQQFPSGLKNVKGDLISKKQFTTEYRSTVNIAGAYPAIVSEQQSPGRKLLAWKVILSSGNDAEVIKTKYREVFEAINNAIIKSLSEKPFILTGKFREAFPGRPAISHFELLPATGDLKEVRLDLVLDIDAKLYSLYIVVYNDSSIR